MIRVCIGFVIYKKVFDFVVQVIPAITKINLSLETK